MLSGDYTSAGLFEGFLLDLVLAISIAFPIAFAAFSFGLLATAPLWWALHRIGMRCWSASMPLGAMLSGGVWFAFTHDLQYAAMLAIVGGIVGGLIWRIAYRATGACAVRVG